MFNEDGGFAVKELTRLVEERTLDVGNAGEDTSWLNLIPKRFIVGGNLGGVNKFSIKDIFLLNGIRDCYGKRFFGLS
ncbi:hypothetical protein Tco_0082885, partial [Tanacetum coccineum]